MGDGMMRDYEEMGALDGYEGRDLDDREYGGMDYEQRRGAERQMDERDARDGRRRGRVEAAMSDSGGAWGRRVGRRGRG